LLDGLTVPSEGDLLGERPVKVELLTNRTGAADRRRIGESLAAGGVDIVVGTHALIYGEVEFPKLGLAVIDEQHRFGVEQRALLRGKGDDPDVLVMTATPIPRTAAMLVYGDLDKSELREMPPGRTPITTDVLVATTVLEVGVDVPNATVMVIEDADRFGLSQLHQLRGRVGRGGGESWCFLLADPQTPEGKARLEAMALSTDGFELAERDLD